MTPALGVSPLTFRCLKVEAGDIYVTYTLHNRRAVKTAITRSTGTVRSSDSSVMQIGTKI